MDEFTFITEIIQALVWPVVALILVFSLRKPLCQLLSTLKSLKYNGLEVRFSQYLKQLENEMPEDIKALSPKKTATVETQSERLKQLIKISPRLAIIEAWRIVELSAVQALQKQENISKPSTGDMLDISRLLEASGLVTETSGEFFRALNRLRNQASHSDDFSISEEDARRYLHNALSLVTYLQLKATE